MKSLEQQMHEAHRRIETLTSEISGLKTKLQLSESTSRRHEVDLVESFMASGLTEQEAEIAADPRTRRTPLLA